VSYLFFRNDSGISFFIFDESIQCQQSVKDVSQSLIKKDPEFNSKCKHHITQFQSKLATNFHCEKLTAVF